MSSLHLQRSNHESSRFRHNSAMNVHSLFTVSTEYFKDWMVH